MNLSIVIVWEWLWCVNFVPEGLRLYLVEKYFQLFINTYILIIARQILTDNERFNLGWQDHTKKHYHWWILHIKWYESGTVLQGICVRTTKQCWWFIVVIIHEFSIRCQASARSGSELYPNAYCFQFKDNDSKYYVTEVTRSLTG